MKTAPRVVSASQAKQWTHVVVHLLTWVLLAGMFGLATVIRLFLITVAAPVAHWGPFWLLLWLGAAIVLFLVGPFNARDGVAILQGSRAGGTVSPHASATGVVRQAPAGMQPATQFDVELASELPRLDSIGGMDELKQELRDTVGLVLEYPEEAAALKIEHGGVLLWGPPGVGKTAMARAVAGEFGLNFLGLNAGLLSTEGLVGVAAKKVNNAFATAEAHLPCLLFIDELETLAPGREAMNTDKPTVGSLLTALTEARKYSGQLVVMGATNHPDMVDAAIRRPGRFDLMVEITLPDWTGRMKIVQAKLQGRAVAADIDVQTISELTDGWSGATISTAVERGALSALRRYKYEGGEAVVTQADLLEGVEHAKKRAEKPSDAAPWPAPW